MEEKSVCPQQLDSMADRSFRDVADQDYIAARSCYRLELTVQFLFMAQQAVEKYLKAILLYNRTSTKKLNHNLQKAYERIFEIEDLEFHLPKDCLSWLIFLNNQGCNRYISESHYTTPDDLVLLDKTVYNLRLYCKNLRHPNMLTGESDLKSELEEIDRWKKISQPYHFRLPNGHLEKVLANQKSPQRQQLVWKNFFYGSRGRGISL